MPKVYAFRRSKNVDVSRFVLLPAAAFSAVFFWPGAISVPTSAPAWRQSDIVNTNETTQFALCANTDDATCVIDGDTFRLDGRKIRIADIDTPETHPARCAEEEALGMSATYRLAELLSAGPFDLQRGLRDRDKHGRELRTVFRDGESLGGILVAEGLARPWEGQRRPWCAA